MCKGKMAAPISLFGGFQILSIPLDLCSLYGRYFKFRSMNHCKRCLFIRNLNCQPLQSQCVMVISSCARKRSYTTACVGSKCRFTSSAQTIRKRDFRYTDFVSNKLKDSTPFLFKNGAFLQSWKSYGTNQADVEKDAGKLNLKKENIWTVPNLLTMGRILLSPVIGYLVVTESYTAAAALCTLAGISDLLDGYIARNFKNQMSALGTALDPLADKILVTVLTVTLTMSELLPVPLAVVIIGRDMLLVGTGFVIRYISLPPPKTLKRYFDVTNPTATLHPSLLSKINTVLQLSLVCLTLAAPVFGYVNHPLLQGLWYITGATTVSSGIGYVINRKKAVQFLHTNTGKTMK